MEQVIRKSAALHLDHTASGDPFEKGSARPLDFGHWVATNWNSFLTLRLVMEMLLQLDNPSICYTPPE